MNPRKYSAPPDFAALQLIFTLAWPTMLEQFMSTCVSYIDTAMVGSLGTAATAAVGSTGTVNWLVLSVINALGLGFLAFIAQAYGSGEKELLRRASAQAVSVAAAVGILMTALTLAVSPLLPAWMQVEPAIRPAASRYFFITYTPMLFRTASAIFSNVLRSVRDSRTPMQVGIRMNLINVVLNFLLIYPTRQLTFLGRSFTIWGAGLEIDGAALATAVSFVYGGIALTLTLWKHPLVSPAGCSFKPDPAILKRCLRIAVPNMFQRFGTSLGYVFFASMINGLGGVATAAHTIANTVESAFYIPGWGMHAAAATLTGNAYGARDRQKLNHLGKAILPLEVGLMMLTGGLLFAFARPLVLLFSRDPEVIRLASQVLRMVAISEPFYGVTIVVEGMMQGVGRTVPPLIFNVSGMWGVRILGTFICTRLLGLGLISAWGCMIGNNMFLFLIYILLYCTGAWNPLNTKKATG